MMIRTSMAVLLLGCMVAPMPARADGEESPAETVRKALDKEITLDFIGQSLDEAIQHLREKTKLKFVVDSYSHPYASGVGAFPLDPNSALQATLKITKGKVRQAVRQMLQGLNLSYVIIGDTVVITTEETGVYRQLKQRVQLDVDKTPLDAALKKLAKTYAVNLVIDPKVAKEAQTPVSLQLDDTALDNAVRLLAELGGVKAVSLGNVLFITDEVKASKIRKEEKSNQPVSPYATQPFMGGIGFGGIGAAPALFPPAPAKVAPPRRDPNAPAVAPALPLDPNKVAPPRQDPNAPPAAPAKNLPPRPAPPAVNRPTGVEPGVLPPAPAPKKGTLIPLP